MESVNRVCLRVRERACMRASAGGWVGGWVGVCLRCCVCGYVLRERVGKLQEPVVLFCYFRSLKI